MNHLEYLHKHYIDQPYEVSLETLARCNAACTFCPYPTLERIGEKMPDNLIHRLIDEMSDWKKPFSFCPFKVSEPLLDKRLYAVLKRFNNRVPKAEVRIFTNGSPLTLQRAEELANIKNLRLYVSLNSHIKEEYEPLMRLSFDRVVKNLDELHDTDFPHEVNVLKVGADEEFYNYVRERWPWFKPLLIKKDSWLGFTDADITEVPTTPCARWFELNIMANGKAALCCMDGTGEHGLGGDVNKQSLLEIYNMPAWRERREKMMNRHEVPVCRQCTY